MQRVALPAGAVIQLNNRDYTIDKMIGDGASCVVYSAYYTDAAGYSHQVNLKECYPYHAEIRRDQQNMLWQSGEEKAQSFSVFRQAYDKLMTWQNNTTVKAFDMCEANNTLYIVMDADQGQPFDKDTGRSLHELLQTALALTKTVQKYHDNGYLHLDIKPSNFLTIPETRELVLLFDLDTVTAISDIRSGNVRCVSYSDGWAAPEQKQGKLDKLCPATDIFAIGAILFEKVMGRQVAPADMSIFANWDFEGELFDDVNPKIKRILRTIFQKTLVANPQRRYQTTDILAEQLGEAVNVARDKVYLLSHNIECTSEFIGREKELKGIQNAFASGSQLVFLHGFGGIGKTEIAKTYAQRHTKDYDAMLFVRYDNNSTLQELLDDIQIANFDGSTIEHRRKLRALLTREILVVVDNYDIEIGSDDGLSELIKTKARILVSTRTDFSDVYANNTAIIEVNELPSDDLRQVFTNNARSKIHNAREQDLLDKTLRLVGNHTYATELLAKQMRCMGWSLETLYQHIANGLSALERTGKIITNKDDRIRKDHSLHIIQAVFCLSDLDERKKQVLRNMCLLNFVKMTKSAYAEFVQYDFAAMREEQGLEHGHSQLDFIDSFNDLVEVGLIKKEQDYYVLHTLIHDLVKAELHPNDRNCVNVYFYILGMIEWFGQSREGTASIFAEAENKASFLLRFFESCDLRQDVHRLFVTKWLDTISQNSYALLNTQSISGKIESLCYRLEETCESLDCSEQYRIYLNLFKTWMGKCNTFLLIEDEETFAHCQRCISQATKIYNMALALAYHEDDGKQEERFQEIISVIVRTVEESKPALLLAKDAYGTITCTAQAPVLPRLPYEIVQEAYSMVPDRFDFTAWEKQFFHLPLTLENQEMLLWENSFPKESPDDDTAEWMRQTDEIYTYFQNSENKLHFLFTLVESDEFNPSQKVFLMEEVLTRIFDEIMWTDIGTDSSKAERFFLDMDWHLAQSLVILQHKIEEKYDGFDWNEADLEYLSHLPIYMSILCAIFDDEDFTFWVRQVISVDHQDREHRGDNKPTFRGWLPKVINACAIMRKCRYILPIAASELIGQMPNFEDDEFEDRLPEFYIEIMETQECAKRALEECENLADDDLCITMYKSAAIDTIRQFRGATNVDEKTAVLEMLNTMYTAATSLHDAITQKRFDLRPED